MPSSRLRARTNWRPLCHVISRKNTAPPSISGNHPPSRIFSRLAAKNAMSTTRKPRLTSVTSTGFQRQTERITTAASTVVMTIVVVTAIP